MLRRPAASLPTMHATLAEHARCLYGDEHQSTPECNLEHSEQYFIEELTFADADSILAMLHELCPHLVDGYLPVWVRNLSCVRRRIAL